MITFLTFWWLVGFVLGIIAIERKHLHPVAGILGCLILGPFACLLFLCLST